MQALPLHYIIADIAEIPFFLHETTTAYSHCFFLCVAGPSDTPPSAIITPKQTGPFSKISGCHMSLAVHVIQTK